jgi:xanthine dehydrogenase accessory factor
VSGEPYVRATVVRARHPTSAQAGDKATVRADGTIEGFVGGSCAEHSVRTYALEALAAGEPLLLRIVPFDGDGEHAAREEGAVTVQNPCLSGGEVEIFLDPVVPAPRVQVVGHTPIADALRRLAPEFGLEVADAPGLAAIVAAQGVDDEHAALRAALEAGVPYVGLVASRKRGDGVIGELRSDGVAPELTDRIDVPAGIAIGARTPAEIALSILARIVAVRRSGIPAAAPAPAVATAVDPICGMTVVPGPSTPSLEHEGETVYFCCEGCRSAFALQHAP